MIPSHPLPLSLCLMSGWSLVALACVLPEEDHAPSFSSESTRSSFPPPPSFPPPYQPTRQLLRPEAREYKQLKSHKLLSYLWFTSGCSVGCSTIEEENPKLLSSSLTTCSGTSVEGTAVCSLGSFSLHQLRLLCRTCLRWENFSSVSFFRYRL